MSSHTRSNRRSKKYRIKNSKKNRNGGASPPPSSYSSATTYGVAVNGSGGSQMHRTYGSSNSPSGNTDNGILGVQNQYSTSIGNKHLYKGGKKAKKGGVFGALGPVLNQAAVPFGILALQQAYGPRSENLYKKRRPFNSRRSRRTR